MTYAYAQQNGLHFLWDDPDLNLLKGTHPI